MVQLCACIEANFQQNMVNHNRIWIVASSFDTASELANTQKVVSINTVHVKMYGYKQKWNWVGEQLMHTVIGNQ